jgi:hypothetical protein
VGSKQAGVLARAAAEADCEDNAGDAEAKDEGVDFLVSGSFFVEGQFAGLNDFLGDVSDQPRNDTSVEEVIC